MTYHRSPDDKLAATCAAAVSDIVDDRAPMLVCTMCAPDFGHTDLPVVTRGECEMCGGGCPSDDCAPWPLVEIPDADADRYYAARRAIIAEAFGPPLREAA